MSRTLDAVAAAYQVFRPKYVRFSQSEHLTSRPGEWARVSLQNQQLAAPLHVIARGDAVPNVERVSLEPARAADVYDRYAQEYESLLSSWPALRDVAPPESRDTLEEAEGAGLLFMIMVDRHWAGVYALQRSEQEPGNYDVVDILIFPAERRRGFAAAAHVAACRRLAPGPRGLLSGTIAGINAPSRRTALRAGRRILKGTYRYSP